MTTEWFYHLDLSSVTTMLVDADGTLFPSEEPAYDASADVTNRFLASLGADREYTPVELQSMTNGKNFRAAAAELADRYGQTLDPRKLDDWVQEEKDVVTRHLCRVLGPDPDVTEPVTTLADRFVLAAVTSSAGSRLDACLETCGLDHLFAPERRFSAESSLPRPTSKPDPAVYVFAGERLGVAPDQAVAVEDSVNGARSAVAAGFPTIGTVQFVPETAREARVAALRDAGVACVVHTWSEILTAMQSPSVSVS
jgi:beta-phosphoglucomutase-like phosphatase (HAD superfamily)